MQYLSKTNLIYFIFGWLQYPVTNNSGWNSRNNPDRCKLWFLCSTWFIDMKKMDALNSAYHEVELRVLPIDKSKFCTIGLQLYGKTLQEFMHEIHKMAHIQTNLPYKLTYYDPKIVNFSYFSLYILLCFCLFYFFLCVLISFFFAYSQ